MPIDLRELRTLEGQTLRILFHDGYEARVKLLHVDVEDHVDFVYDVLEVLQWGPIDPKSVDKKAVYVAQPDEVSEYEVLSRPGA